MKRIITLLFLCSLAFAAYAETTPSDLGVDPSKISPEDYDLSEARFFLQGPVEIYVDQIKYKGENYSVILDCDGIDSFDLKIPPQYTTANKPQMLDLSDVSVSTTPDGKVSLSGITADGYIFAGNLAFTDNYTALTLTETPKVTGSTESGPSEIEITQMEKKIKSLQRMLKDYVAQTEELEDTVASQEEKMASQEETIEDLRSGNKDVATLTDKISDLKDEIENRDTEISELNSQISTLTSEITELRSMTAEKTLAIPKNSVASGFGNKTAAYGSWNTSGSNLTQGDGNAKFAKYIQRVSQTDSKIVYTINAEGPSTGWTGYGLHFLASGSEKADTYGFGESILVWLTRDPANQTDKTFVQIYRSFDDVHMVQVANQVIDASIADMLETSIEADRSTNTISVFVNGDHEVSYECATALPKGNYTALRALGKTTFTDFKVNAE